jgi:hypothetical protein
MASDLSAVFTYDFGTTAKIGTKTYTVLVGNAGETEEDAYGGPQDVDLQQVHFQASELSSVEIGSIMYVTDASGTKKRIVVNTTLSADGVELIVNVRAA